MPIPGYRDDLLFPLLIGLAFSMIPAEVLSAVVAAIWIPAMARALGWIWAYVGPIVPPVVAHGKSGKLPVCARDANVAMGPQSDSGAQGYVVLVEC